MLAPLPFTSSFLPTDILLYRPSTLETYELALKCDRRPDPRAVVRNWFENGGIVETFATPLEGIRQMCSWVIKWWEMEMASRDLRSLDDRTDEDAQKRWRKVEQGIVGNLAVEAVVSYIGSFQSKAELTSPSQIRPNGRRRKGRSLSRSSSRCCWPWRSLPRS